MLVAEPPDRDARDAELLGERDLVLHAVRVLVPDLALHAGEVSAVYETLAIRAAMHSGPLKDVIRKAA
jgi:hypothetical protein